MFTTPDPDKILTSLRHQIDILTVLVQLRESRERIHSSPSTSLNRNSVDIYEPVSRRHGEVRWTTSESSEFHSTPEETPPNSDLEQLYSFSSSEQSSFRYSLQDDSSGYAVIDCSASQLKNEFSNSPPADKFYESVSIAAGDEIIYQELNEIHQGRKRREKRRMRRATFISYIEGGQEALERFTDSLIEDQIYSCLFEFPEKRERKESGEYDVLQR